MMLLACVYWLKLVSYAHANGALYAAWKQKAHNKKTDLDSESESDAAVEIEQACSIQQSIAYPGNLTVTNLLQFIAVPTLCYQLNYPQAKGVRRMWLFKRVLELLSCLAVMVFLIQRFISPITQQSKTPLENLDFWKLLEVWLKLSIPMLGFWLLMFYALFHLWLNIVAEITCFGDRRFYTDWWNASKLEDYWKRWNIPVHNWLVRHVYMPVLRLGFSPNIAALSVFLFSAFFHELLISVPCHTCKLWAFLGILGQMPLVQVTRVIDKRLEGSQIGNMIFWFTFCFFGQPICAILYYYDFVQSQN